jgi:hypothetical protein
MSHCFCFFLLIEWEGLHSGDVESESCHFMFYWMVRVEVDCSVGGGWFPVYIYFEICLFSCYCQVQVIYGVMGFVCGIEF